MPNGERWCGDLFGLSALMWDCDRLDFSKAVDRWLTIIMPFSYVWRVFVLFPSFGSWRYKSFMC